MSLTIRMKRALAAFRADPLKPMVSVTVPRGGSIHTTYVGGGGGGGLCQPNSLGLVNDAIGGGRIVDVYDGERWNVHSDYHRSRIIMGHRLDWYTTKTGKRESAQYKDRMYYNADVRTLFRGLGLKDRQ